MTGTDFFFVTIIAHHSSNSQTGLNRFEPQQEGGWRLQLHSLKLAQLLCSAACLHINQSRSYLNHLVRFTVTMELLTCTGGLGLLITVTLELHLPFLKNSLAMGKFGNNIFKQDEVLYFRTLVLTCKQIFQSYLTTRNVCR